LSLEEMQRKLKFQNTYLEEQVARKTAEIRQILNASIRSMAYMLEIRDPYTAGHQQRVAELACAIAEKLGLSPATIDGIRIAGILHDVGKIRIPLSILSRSGELLDADAVEACLKLFDTDGFAFDTSGVSARQFF
jgi:putative two-component system response regulator